MLPIAVLQIVTFPYLARVLGATAYGEAVFLISVFTIISFPFGNVLNNLRLLKSEDYKEGNLTGDFNRLLVYSILISVFTFLIYTTQNSLINYKEIILLLIIIILALIKEYYIVSFRLTLNFKKIMVNNLLLAIGYLIGTYVFKVTGYWEYVYIIGLIISNIYIFRNTKLIKEGFEKTPLFKSTLSSGLYLYFAGLLKNLVTHADKLLLFPLLGAKNVAVYYTAAIIGRMVSMFVSPANTVILSYLVKVNKKIKVLYYLLVALLLGAFFYFLILFIGPVFLKVLYSEWHEESVKILKYTAAATIFSVIAGLFHPFNLRFNDIKWQLYINGSYLMIYVGLAVILTSYYGLIGFSIGVLLANIYNFFIQIFIYYYNSNSEAKQIKKETRK